MPDNNENEPGALLVKPDVTGYLGSLGILIGGFFMGLFTVIYGWLGIELSKPRPTKHLGDQTLYIFWMKLFNFKLKWYLIYFQIGFLRRFNRLQSNQELVKQIKRILYETHIKFEDVANNNFDIRFQNEEKDGGDGDDKGDRAEILSIYNNDLERHSRYSRSQRSVRFYFISFKKFHLKIRKN